MTTNTSNQNYEDLKLKFKHMIKGSKMAKHLSIVYAVISFTIAYKYRDELIICLPLIVSGLLVSWYTLTRLWLNGIKDKPDSVKELIDNINRYKEQTLKREKYEQFVIVFWFLTQVPVYLDDKTISAFLVVKILVVFYIFTIIGTSLFDKVKEDIKEMECLINRIA